MNTDMPQDQRFIKQYQKHLKCLKLGGLQPKTIDAYARAIRRIGNYFDCQKKRGRIYFSKKRKNLFYYYSSLRWLTD